MTLARTEILARLRSKVARGEPIIGGGAGTGLSAKCEAAAGIDLKKGGLARLEVESQLRFGPCAKLAWLLTPKKMALMV